MGYQGRTYSPSSIYRTDDRKYQDLIAKHNQSQILIKKDIDRRPVDRYQANYYSPNKKRSIESYSYTKNNLSSEKVTQNIEKYHNASVTKYNNNYSRIHIDTS